MKYYVHVRLRRIFLVNELQYLQEILSEALRQWNDFKDDRKDCTLEDYNSFILEIYGQTKEGVME